MDSLIAMLMKQLYINGEGMLPLQRLINIVHTNSPEEMMNADDNNIRFWILNLNSDYFKLKPNNMVVGLTKARLCDQHTTEAGSCHDEMCSKLHICRYFLLSDKFKCSNNCKFLHDLRNPHNIDVLRCYKLDLMTVEELRRLFRNSENRSEQTIPQICWNYNSRKCDKKACRFLHLCKSFIIGKCPFGERCRLTHKMDYQAISIFADYGIYLPINEYERNSMLVQIYSAIHEARDNDTRLLKSVSMLKLSKDVAVTSRHCGEKECEVMKKNPGNKHSSLSSSMKNLSTIANKSPRQTDRKKEKKGICINFLSGKPCQDNKDDVNKKAVACVYNHKPFPYQWQYKISSDDWQDFHPEMNEMLEKSFCFLELEFHVPCYSGFKKYDFQRMTFTNAENEGKLRRLSTPSSVVYQNSEYNTKWIWYWNNGFGRWMEFSPETQGSPILSSEIEKKYLANKEGKLNFIHNGITCLIDFKNMFMESQIKQDILRRPLFFNRRKKTQTKYNEPTKKEREMKAKPESLEKPKFKPRKNPKKQNVSKNEKSNHEKESTTDFKIVKLLNNEERFQRVAEQFNKTMKAREAEIICIENIKNPELWEEYERRKTKMIKKLENVNELHLFHGTDSSNINAIAKQGFDVRLSGEQVGTRFGQGTYFTRKADYAHKYMSPVDGLHKMLLVKVLAGLSCQGKLSYKRPPPIDRENESSDLYNSCVDDVENPNVFVIFGNDQMFPAYIITYKMLS